MPCGFFTSEAYLAVSLVAATPTEHGRPSLASRTSRWVMRAMCSGEPCRRWQWVTSRNASSTLNTSMSGVMATSACMMRVDTAAYTFGRDGHWMRSGHSLRAS